MGVSVFRVPQRLYWTADRGRLVGHGDPDGAFLAFSAGQELSMEEARRFGLLDRIDTPVTAAGKARTEPVGDKLGARPADKSAARSIVAREKA